jgi:hypothetical protein
MMPLDPIVSKKEEVNGTRDMYHEFMNMKKDPRTCSHATRPPSGIAELYVGGGGGWMGKDSAEPETLPDDDDPASSFSSLTGPPLLFSDLTYESGIDSACKDFFDPAKDSSSTFSLPISAQKWGTVPIRDYQQQELNLGIGMSRTIIISSEGEDKKRWYYKGRHDIVKACFL